MPTLGVYALCKDQEDQVDSFMDCMADVDHVLVVDLGSKDGSVQRLKSRGARVIELKMGSDRADLSRIAALEAMPEDLTVCMCAELYQTFGHGWAIMVKNSWFDGCTRMTYWINEGKRRYYGDWIHSRKGYTWQHPIYEELIPVEIHENQHHCEIDVYQGQIDPAPNIEMMSLAINENPHLGYLRMMMAKDCLFVDKADDHGVSPHFRGQLAVGEALVCDDLSPTERAFTCYLGSLYALRGAKYDDEEIWLSRAIIEEPESREWWYHYADFCLRHKHVQRSLTAIKKAESLNNTPNFRYNQLDPWGPELYLLGAKCALAADNRGAAEGFYVRGTRLFTDNVQIAKEYGELIS